MQIEGRLTFAALLRHILVTEQNRKLKDVAAQIGLSTRNFYGRVTGRIQFSPEEINRVIRAVPDPRLADWILAGTDLACIQRIAAAPRDPDASTVDLALHCVEASMGALRSVLQLRPADAAANVPAATADLAISRAEVQIEAAQRQLAALQLNLRMRLAVSPAPA